MNKVIVFVITAWFSVAIGVSPDTHYFSIINNTKRDFDIEISYGVKGDAATLRTVSKKADVEIGEHYEGKQLFNFYVGDGIDIQKTQIQRYPMYLRLFAVEGNSSENVYQRADRTLRKEVAIGVDNVFNKSGVVFNENSEGTISYKFYDGRPDTKVIKRANKMMDDDR